MHRLGRWRAPLGLVGAALALAFTLTAVSAADPADLSGSTPAPPVSDQWSLCPVPPPPPPPPAGPDSEQPTLIDADRSKAVRQGVSVLSGNVDIRQGQRELKADRAEYDSRDRTVRVEGNVHYASPTLSADGDKGHYNLDSGKGELSDAEYFLPQRHGRGAASTVETLDQDHSRLSDVSYTTCPAGDTDWELLAPELDLDHAAGVGTGHNVHVDFFGVPFFYTPYISFPLDDRRKSGFLAPSFGGRGTTGTEIEIPYYWNIAPDMDATITPRNMTRRGIMTNLEYRYLTESTAGRTNVSYLANDRVTGATRDNLHYDQKTDLGDSWTFSANLNHVSDPLYFTDFGNSLAVATTVSQPSVLRLGYTDTNWQFATIAQSIQTLNPTTLKITTPYRTLPRVSLDWSSDDTGLGPAYSVDTEFTRFQLGGHTNALRLDLEPRASYTFGTPGYYVTPTVGMSAAHYSLLNPGPSQPDGISRTAPIFSLDSGLYFTRDAGSTGDLIQTLEPRLFYLYVPYRNQDQIPRFDTGLPTFNMLQLFTENRFTGTDRLGDANQISYALTSRLLDKSSGKELLEASIGQIHYFADRRVQLTPSRPVETATRSDWVAESRLALGDAWSASANMQWSPTTRDPQLASLQLQYAPGPRQVVNASYRFHRGQIKQTDLSFSWPLTRNVSMVGRWNYSIKDHVTLESFAGLQYETCCWAFQAVTRHFVTSTGETDSALFFQLELKGLGSVGRRLDDFLERGILGYQSN